jgi:hypothetical protein
LLIEIYDIQAQTFNYIRAALINKKNEGIDLKDVNHMMHIA